MHWMEKGVVNKHSSVVTEKKLHPPRCPSKAMVNSTGRGGAQVSMGGESPKFVKESLKLKSCGISRTVRKGRGFK